MYGLHYSGCQCHSRHFLTTKEKIEKLKEYKEWLDNESKGVNETIKELEKAD